MYHFFVEPDQIEEPYITITGKDVNHIKNVIRLSAGDEIVLCDKAGREYFCYLDLLTNDGIRCKIQTKGSSKAELPCKVSLMQGAPKQDKMEMIVIKSVELGVYDIVPVEMKRSVVKYDVGKAHKKVARWQSLAESAAKQSKRGIIPVIHDFLNWKSLLTKLKGYDIVIVPYENESGMAGTRQVFGRINAGDSVAVVIGPEGGFEPSEIEDLLGIGGITVSLGNRILRTETAGFASLAMIGYQTEEV